MSGLIPRAYDGPDLYRHDLRERIHRLEEEIQEETNRIAGSECEMAELETWIARCKKWLGSP